jgi:predicted amidohydrolase YtcJ
VLLGVDADDDVAVDGWARVGPAKLLADEALGLDPGALAVRIAAHHAAGRLVAIHAVTRAENVAAVAALAEAGTLVGDRIEHGSVLPHDLDPFLAAHGVTVVVQPSLVAERGDHHLAEVDADDLPLLHRHASLLAAGVRVGVGSDAPVTSADPWAGIAAASTRRTRSGADLGFVAEAVPPRLALDWYLADPLDPGGPPRRVEPGAPGDLCLLDRPLDAALAEPSAGHVRSTWVGGRLVRP